MGAEQKTHFILDISKCTKCVWPGNCDYELSGGGAGGTCYYPIPTKSV